MNKEFIYRQLLNILDEESIKVDELMKINEDLNISIVKTETQIQQEQVSKELWLIKLDYLIKEHDNLKAKLNGTYTRENRNKNSETRSENKEKKRTLSVDAIENRSQFIRNKTMNLVGLNNKLNMDIMNIIQISLIIT